jgi:hypothetical protein
MFLLLLFGVAVEELAGRSAGEPDAWLMTALAAAAVAFAGSAREPRMSAALAQRRLQR